MSEISQTRQNRPIVVIKPKRTLPSLMAVVGGVVVLVGVGYGLWSYVPQKPPTAAPSASAQLPPIPQVISSVSGLAVPDAHLADPSMLLPKIQRALFPHGEKNALIRIKVTGSTRGTVDLTKPNHSIAYVYRDASPKEKGAPVMNRSYELQKEGGGPSDLAAQKNEWDVPEPNCTWTAAWRAAVKSGIPDSAEVNGLYEKIESEPRWRISVANQPELTRELNGMTCAIKTH